MPFMIARNPLVLQRYFPEIQKQTQLKPTCFQIIIYLSEMLVSKSRYRLQFHDNLAVTNEINSKFLFQFTSFILNTKRLFAFKRNAT